MLARASFLILCICNLAEASPAKALCATGEKVVFSCATSKGKLISLCGSADLSKSSGSLQYRFGKPGKIELEFPAVKTNSAQSFKYAHYFRSQVDLTHITFKNGVTSYTIFSEYDGESKPTKSEAGVRVAPGGQTIRCRGKVSAAFGDLDQILACDPDNDLGQECPPG